MIIKNLRIKQQWLDDDNRIQTEEVEEWSLICCCFKSFFQIVFFKISLKEKNMKEDMKPQISAPVRHRKKSKDSTKSVSENLTALLQGKLNTSNKSPLHVTDGETWTINSGAWVETTGTWTENKSYLFSDQASAGSPPLLEVTASGGICTNICHLITRVATLSYYKKHGLYTVWYFFLDIFFL